MQNYEIEIGEYLTDKIKFIHKTDPEFKDNFTCPFIHRMDRLGYTKEENLNKYLEEHKDKVIYFLLTEDDSVFHPFVYESNQQFYCIRSRYIN